MIRLRPHHMLCILNFQGKGYSYAFVENMEDIIARICKGEKVLIVEGADDICAALHGSKHWHCDQASVEARDRVATDALNLSVGMSFDLSRESIEKLKNRYAEGAFESCCLNCEWKSVCRNLV